VGEFRVSRSGLIVEEKVVGRGCGSEVMCLGEGGGGRGAVVNGAWRRRARVNTIIRGLAPTLLLKLHRSVWKPTAAEKGCARKGFSFWNLEAKWNAV
jgi:hypothetical protein